MKMKFYECAHCGNIIVYVKASGVSVLCCGQKMAEIKAGQKDAALEKHVPVFEVNGDEVTVSVGATLHPMGQEHSIEWIAIETKQGNQRKELKVDSVPKASFKLASGDEVEAVYAYCNLHGLWRA